MDSNGRKFLIVWAVSQEVTFHPRSPNTICSIIAHRIKNPSAKADRFTKIPRKSQKEKKPTNFTK